MYLHVCVYMTQCVYGVERATCYFSTLPYGCQVTNQTQVTNLSNKCLYQLNNLTDCLPTDKCFGKGFVLLCMKESG